MRDELTFQALRAANLARCGRWHRGGLDEWSLSDWAVAMAGECGEACDVVKKLNRVRDGLVGNKVSPAQLLDDLAEELADVQIYLDLLAARAGIDLAAATVAKFDKVSRENGFPERLA